MTKTPRPEPTAWSARGSVVAESQRYTVTLVADRRRRVFVPVPFDPDVVWGHKVEHHVHGTVDHMGVRGVIEPLDDDRGVVLGPAWRRDCGLAAGDTVEVVALLAAGVKQRPGT